MPSTGDRRGLWNGVCVRVMLILLIGTLAAGSLLRQPQSARAQEPAPPGAPGAGWLQLPAPGEQAIAPQPDAAFPDGDFEAASVGGLAPFADIKALSLGTEHSCLLTNAGAVFCMGQNNVGQLGDGTTTNRLLPVAVSGLSSGVLAVAVGRSHSCAALTAGGIKCWGSDIFGQLGDGGSATDRSTPVSVANLPAGTAPLAISAGEYHTCALMATGGVYCWGDDNSGQLGNGTPLTAQTRATVVSGLGAGVKAIGAGLWHTCAVLNSGKVQCWGEDNYGQLGNDNLLTDQATPVPVLVLASGVVEVKAGSGHTCARKSDKSVWCWGRNDDGQLGDGTVTNKTSPVQISALGTSTTSLAVGGYHTCATQENGGAVCWGRNSSGQLGDGSATAQRYPKPMAGIPMVPTSVSAGAEGSCVLLGNTSAVCTGYNRFGQLGTGNKFNQYSPVPIVKAATCYNLQLTVSGALPFNGAVPVPSLDNSPSCPYRHYLQGTTVLLTAAPNADFRVNAWTSPAQGMPGSPFAVLTMPAADTTIGVGYAACRTLTLTFTGTGVAPIAVPDRSPGCALNKYVQNERIVVLAMPGAGQRVSSWTGASVTPGAGNDNNTLLMPNAAHTVSVAYGACAQLSAVVSGQGQPPGAYPASSLGCTASRYAAGETITLAASPAPGWMVAAWGGAAPAAGGATLNMFTMPEGDATVSITYEPASVKIFVPTVNR